MDGCLVGGLEHGWIMTFHSHDESMVLVYMLTKMGYIDGIHGTPYMAAPWIRHGYVAVDQAG